MPSFRTFSVEFEMGNKEERSASLPASDADAIELAMEKYKLDRAHELELNKFAHALEMERLKILSYLNGGAVGVYLVLMKEALSKSEAGLILASSMAVLFWLLGLIAAACAIRSNLTAQVEFARAYHRRRRATEWRTFEKAGVKVEELKHMIAPPPELPGPLNATGDRRFDAAALLSIKRGDMAKRQIGYRALFSVAFFVVGSLFAGVGVIKPALLCDALPDNVCGAVGRSSIMMEYSDS
jgi:hypothetical protein